MTVTKDIARILNSTNSTLALSLRQGVVAAVTSALVADVYISDSDTATEDIPFLNAVSVGQTVWLLKNGASFVGLGPVGSSAKQPKIGSFTGPTSTGNKAVTGVGFKPRLVEFNVIFTASDDARAVVNLGAMDAAGNQFRTNSYVTSSLQRSRSAQNQCLAAYQSPGGTFTAILIAAFVSMDSDGFTVNFTTATAAGSDFTVNWIAYP